MNIDLVLENISTVSDKDIKYIKGLYTQEKNKLTEQFGESISDERKSSIALIKIGKKYDIEKSNIDEWMKSKDEMLYDDTINLDDDILDLEGDIVTEEDQVGNDFDSDDFFAGVPDPIFKKNDSVKYEKTPPLSIEIGATYYLKMADFNKPPAITLDGKYGPYIKYPLKVFLVKVTDEELYNEKFNEGAFKGEKKYINGNKYTFWIDEKAFGFMKLFWKKITNDGNPDDRTFRYKFVKKGNYNVYKFSEA